MSDEHEIMDGRVLVYRTTHSGDVYQVRIYLPDERRYVRKSLRTRNLEDAKRAAHDLYVGVQAKVLKGEKLFSITAEELRDRWLEKQSELVEGGVLSRGRYSNMRTFTKHYLEFVGAKERIQNIDQKRFEGYRAFRQSQKSDIRLDVVLNESVTIKQMYNWARREGLIRSNYECDFGRIKVDKNALRRDVVTVEDYKALTAVARLWYKDTKDEEEVYYRKAIRDFIVIQANSGLRTGELLTLQWRDVEIRRGSDRGDSTAQVTVQREKTKVRQKRTIICRRGDVFQRRMEYGQFTDADDYVFCNFGQRKQLTTTNLYDYFSDLKKVVKAKHESFDSNMDLYSLRHFYITNHLSTGRLSPYDLAKYCGTSLRQLEKTYDHVKQAEVSQKILSNKFKFDENNQIVLDDD